MLKTCIGLRCFGDFDKMAEEFVMMKEAGLDTMDLDLSETQIIEKTRSGEIEENIAKAKELFARYDTRIEMCHAPFHVRVMNDDAATERMLEDIRLSIRTAGALDIPAIVVHPYFALYDDVLWGKNDLLLEKNVEMYTELVALGKKYGVTVCTENMFVADHSEHAIPCWCSTAGDLLAIMDRVPGLEVCLDNGHGELLDLDTVQMARDFGSRLRLLHLHCNDHHRDTHVSPFELRTLNWEGFCAALKDVGYAGPMNLEIHNFYYYAPKAMLPHSFRYLQACAAYLAELTENA